MNAAKHLPHDNGGAAGNWNVLSSRPLLRGALAFGEIRERKAMADTKPFGCWN
jgi:hypothetical protein